MSHASVTPHTSSDAADVLDAPTREKVLVVGAGPAGLAAAAALKALRVPFDLVDGNKDVGGIWNEEREDSPVWPAMEMVSSTRFTQYEDMIQPVSFPPFLRPGQMAKYLRAYAARYELTDHFLPKVSVRTATPFDEEGVWQVELSNGKVAVYSALVAAHGISGRPHLPRWASEVPDEVRTLHAAQWTGSDGLEGKRVLIVGSGQSAADIAVDAARRALEVRWSVRTGHWVVPRSIGGRPGDVAASHEPSLLGPLNEKIAEQAVRRTIGDPQSLGLPRPSASLLEDAVIISDELAPRIRDGRVTPTGDVESIAADATVSFSAGAEYTPDVIVFATGYEQASEYLPEDVVPRTADGELDLFLGTFPRGRDNLVLLGQQRVNGGVLPLLVEQADVAAYALHAMRSGSAQAEEFRRIRERGDSEVPAHEAREESGVRGKLESLLPGRREDQRSDAGAAAASRSTGASAASRSAGASRDEGLVPFVDRDRLLGRLRFVRGLFA
ncbi:flavoprotein [Brachybacterium endophyticum]|uniref:Flavoprotein n=1 Tax=Brachybacterium endophyticum TaxID=2182385 RepID=A0A2U2RMC1_9MICO|nr:NAD(P)-binding domain-containing protein [Brachybacterium endophyticum]PWH07020.1 flavoprotein [Brachybacterium endophyticum]